MNEFLRILALFTQLARRNTRFFTRRQAALIAGMALIPHAAAALPALGGTPEEISRLHCQLLLHASGDPRPLSNIMLDEMVGEAGFSRRAGVGDAETLARVTDPYPDMGFVAGPFWPRADRAERRALNEAITKALIGRYGLHPDARMGAGSYADYCHVRVQLFEPQNAAEATLVEDRHLLAIAQTALPGEKGEVSLQYSLEKLPARGWEMTDMALNGHGLLAGYGQYLIPRISRDGFISAAESLRAGAVSP